MTRTQARLMLITGLLLIFTATIPECRVTFQVPGTDLRATIGRVPR